MSGKTIHILILPQGLGKTRRIRLPKFLCNLALNLLVLFSLAVGYVLFDYTSIKKVERKLARLERKNQENKDHFMRMAGEIAILADKMAESQGLAGHEKTIAALRETLELLGPQEGKTRETRSMTGAFIASARYETMIRQMHDSLDYLQAEVKALAQLHDRESLHLALKSGELSDQAIDARKASKLYEKTVIKGRLRTIARELGLAPRLALSMAHVESGFDHRAVSPRGAIGVLQVMPRLAAGHFEIDPEMLFDPEVNIWVGLLHMKSLLERFDDDLDLSLAAYNAGARRVIVAGYRVPPISETRQYVKRVKLAMNQYESPVTFED